VAGLKIREDIQGKITFERGLSTLLNENFMTYLDKKIILSYYQ
jgi:hypothetical protein